MKGAGTFRLFVATTLVVAVFYSTCAANDVMVTLAAGGIVPLKSTAVRIISENLVVTPARVEIVYQFANDSDHDITSEVGFPLPELNGTDVAVRPIRFSSKDPTNYIDFAVTSGGTRLSPTAQIQVLANGHEITGRVRDLGLPLSVLDKRFDAAFRKLPATVRKQLLDQELVVDEPSGAWPRWSNKIWFHWKQKFPAHKTIELRQSYKPIVGGFYWVANQQQPDELKNFCVTPEQRKDVKSVVQNRMSANGSDALVFTQQVEYTLTTGAKWNGPIGTFHLLVATPKTQDVLLSCFPGLHRTGPKTFEVTRQLFTPGQELKLLIVSSQDLSGK